MDDKLLKELVATALAEDIGDGDHSSLACIPENAIGSAKLIIKQKGILAGVKTAKKIFSIIDPSINFTSFIKDGAVVEYGDIAFHVSGKIQSILKSERLVLNIMQRMSGIAATTREYADRLTGLQTKILDTRKTGPGLRFLEKEAVRIGGGVNHRMGLYDMIMLKDNHIDYAGGIKKAISLANDYLRQNNLKLKIEIEARNIDDVKTIIETGGIDRIMLDNFTITNLKSAISLINGKYETEASGGITLETIRSYAECGVDFISVGALTHHIKSLDMSLKAF
jgi:nicotinate-nucleotide pyrophosphorylase (carboxylating)